MKAFTTPSCWGGTGRFSLITVKVFGNAPLCGISSVKSVDIVICRTVSDGSFLWDDDRRRLGGKEPPVLLQEFLVPRPY